MKLGVLASGKLGLDILSKIDEEYNVLFVLTDSNSQSILSFCNSQKIPFFKGNPRNGKGFNFIKEYNVDMLISVNYLFLIEKDIYNYPVKLTFNIHGSLLPKYRGRTPHVWAIINNEKVTGITAHEIDEGCDTGDIIEQVTIPIENEDTGGSILNKFMSQYYPLIKNVIENCKKQELTFQKQDESKSTYFGKRTPDDGVINWSWTCENIINWIRAQAYPYPGAFTYFNRGKIIIDKVSKADFNFNPSIANGTILQTTPELLVKISDGVLSVDKIRGKFTFETGSVFSMNKIN